MKLIDRIRRIDNIFFIFQVVLFFIIGLLCIILGENLTARICGIILIIISVLIMIIFLALLKRNI